MFGSLSSAAGAPLVDKATFDAVNALIDVARDPDKAAKLLKELIEASATAKRDLDVVHEATSALAAAEREQARRIKSETAEHEARLHAEREQCASECARRLAEVAERERLTAVALEQARSDAKRAETARVNAEQKLQRMQEIWR
jgi:hypothetical protein